jgi:MFS family permease
MPVLYRRQIRDAPVFTFNEEDVMTQNPVPGTPLSEAQAIPPDGTGGTIDTPLASKGFQSALVLATFGLNFVTVVPSIITLAVRMNTVAHGDQRAATNALSVVLLIGTLITILANPLFATFSDRTTLRFGRRRPWLIGGAVVGFAGTVIAGVGTNVPTIVVGWALVQLGFGAATVTATALVPERLAPSQRGKYSGLVGMSVAIAVFLGAQASAHFIQHQAALMIIPGVIAVALIGVLVILLRGDQPADTQQLPPFRLGRFIGSFWINPLRNRDFGFVWVGRFLIGLGTASFQAYTLYFIIANLHVPIEKATAINALMQTIIIPINVVLFFVSGWLTDRLGRRKPFVFAGGVLVAVALVLAPFTHTEAMFIVVASVMTAGTASILTVDVALAADVLPDKREPGRGMAVYGLSTSTPNSIVSVIAPLLLAIGSATSGNYGLLFMVMAPVALIGAALTFAVRGVK